MEKGEKNTSLNHFLLVPHGIRSYADKKSCSFLDAYDATSLIFKDVMRWVFVDYNIEEFTFIALTLNAMQKRSEDELTPVIEVESSVYEEPSMIEFLTEHSIKVTFKGNFSKLPKYYKRAMKNIEKLTEKNKRHRLNVLIGYGPGNKSIFEKIRKRMFSDIFTRDPPDLIVSTAGRDFSLLFDKIPEKTKTIVVDTLFPELTKSDIESYIHYYVSQ